MCALTECTMSVY